MIAVLGVQDRHEPVTAITVQVSAIVARGHIMEVIDGTDPERDIVATRTRVKRDVCPDGNVVRRKDVDCLRGRIAVVVFEQGGVANDGFAAANHALDRKTAAVGRYVEIVVNEIVLFARRRLGWCH